MSDHNRRPSVALIAFVKDPTGTTAATILVDGAAPLFSLTEIAMEAVASQHPHLGGKPIVALRYDMARNT